VAGVIAAVATLFRLPDRVGAGLKEFEREIRGADADT
jgi:hypothetical protein